MKILIDECVDVKLKFILSRHGFECRTVREMGFASKRNGELLDLANGDFDVLLTIDKSIQYQQNMTERKIAVLVIRTKTSKLGDILAHVPAAVTALQKILPGEVIHVGEGIYDC